jgi:hypothetical protein
MLCGIIPPRWKELSIGYFNEEYFPECILPYAHGEPHVFKTPGNKYFSWETDWDCDCCDDPTDSDHCFVYNEISESEFLEIDKKGK